MGDDDITDEDSTQDLNFESPSLWGRASAQSGPLLDHRGSLLPNSGRFLRPMGSKDPIGPDRTRESHSNSPVKETSSFL